jgi:tetratricopeptide (TPR) repeat protein
MANGDSAVVLNRDGANPHRFLVGPQRDIRNTAVSPNKRWVVTCSWGADPVSNVRVWDARTGEAIHELPLRDSAYFAWFSSDSRWLVTTSFGVECRLWEAGTWREVRRYGEAYVAFSPDGQVMALGDIVGQVRLVEPATDREIARLTGPEPGWYDPACFTPDGTRLIAVDRDRRSAYSWDLRAVQAGLRDLGLDWELPPFPPEPPAGPAPRVEVDRGFLASDADFPDPAKAIALFSLAAALQPFHAEAYLQRGRAWGRLDRPREAIADYGAFLALAPHDPRRSEVLFRRATNLDKLGDAEAALRDLLEVAQLGPAPLPWPGKVARRCNECAWQLVTGPAQRWQPDRALILARTAVGLEPESAIYRNTLGVAYYRLGRWREAVEALEPNLRHQLDWAAWDLYFLAGSYHRLGDADRARKQFDRATHWQEENRPRLSTEQCAELRAFRTEVEKVLRGPPGRASEKREHP